MSHNDQIKLSLGVMITLMVQTAAIAWFMATDHQLILASLEKHKEHHRQYEMVVSKQVEHGRKLAVINRILDVR